MNPVHSQKKHCIFALIGLLVGLLGNAQQTAPKVPVGHFAALPSFSRAALSPSGEDIGYIADLNGRSHLVLQKLDGSERQIIPPGESAEIQQYYWATDDRVLIVYDAVDKQRNRNIEITRLVGINRTTKKDPKSLNFRYLILPSGDVPKSTGIFPLAQQDYIISLLPDDPEHILIAVDDDANVRTEVRRVNIHTGKYREVEPRLNATTWFVDNNHIPRVALNNGHNDRLILWLKNQENKWINLAKTKWPEGYAPLGVAENPDYMYAFGHSEYGTLGVYLINLLSGEIVEEVFSHELVDILDLVKHPDPDSNKPVGVEYLLDLTEIQYFDTEMQQLQKNLDKALPQTHNRIVSKARKKPIYLILSYNDRDPGVYYWYDTEAGRLYVIAPIYSNIDPTIMASTQSVTYTARDNTPIPAYLTLPFGMEQARGLPTVILPHGGPHVRDSAAWDFLSQFLANRGYAVLRPNFRGSEGYGYQHKNAGENQWGGLMQDDVTDATRWMIDQGYADPNRICIVGYSYGGYAALMGAIKEPELYQCAASGNGVANIPALKKFFISLGFIDSTVGLEGHKNKEVSPHHQSDRINIPILFLASKDDGRVPYQQSEKMHKKLLSLDKDSTFMLMEDGGHNIYTARARLTLLTELEKFLQKHLH